MVRSILKTTNQPGSIPVTVELSNRRLPLRMRANGALGRVRRTSTGGLRPLVTLMSAVSLFMASLRRRNV